MNKRIYLSLLLMAVIVYSIMAQEFGSAGALSSQDFTLDEMLQYAWEDEHMALAEYEAIMKEFNVSRPYFNIARSETTHITYLKELYDVRGLDYPPVYTGAHLYIPQTLSEAVDVGIDAEIKNIAMYEKFLKEDLPEDVERVFNILMKGSENHLAAFQRQQENTSGQGRR